MDNGELSSRKHCLSLGAACTLYLCSSLQSGLSSAGPNAPTLHAVSFILCLRSGLLPALAYASGTQKAGCSPQPCACAGLCTPVLAHRQHAAGSPPLPCPRGPGPPRLVRLYAFVGRPCYGCCAQTKLFKGPNLWGALLPKPCAPCLPSTRPSV